MRYTRLRACITYSLSGRLLGLGLRGGLGLCSSLGLRSGLGSLGLRGSLGLGGLSSTGLLGGSGLLGLGSLLLSLSSGRLGLLLGELCSARGTC
jgi:hypothetical protein